MIWYKQGWFCTQTVVHLRFFLSFGHKSLSFVNRGGVILQGTELVVTAILSFTSGGFHISMKNSYPASAGTSVLVCGQSTVILTFLKEDYYV
jgi:hypothetical protein